MPHQEIYLAALDRQSCSAMMNLSALMREPELKTAAQSKAESIRRENRF
jgi:hypothetical protein